MKTTNTKNLYPPNHYSIGRVSNSIDFLNGHLIDFVVDVEARHVNAVGRYHVN